MRALWAAGITVAICVLVLGVDQVVVSTRIKQDDKLIKALQEKVKNDGALAPKLASEQKRVTEYRLSRKNRDKGAAWVLIFASVAFVTLAKRRVPLKRRAAPLKASAGSKKTAHARVKNQEPEFDLAFVDEAVARIGRGKEAAIPLLQAIQQHYRYLPDAALQRVCDLTEITASQIAGTSSFYGQFRRTPVGKHIVKVCHGTACHVAGATAVTEELRRQLKIPEGSDTDPERLFTVEEVACLGCCSLAPVMMVDEQTAGRLTPSAAYDALQEHA